MKKFVLVLPVVPLLVMSFVSCCSGDFCEDEKGGKFWVAPGGGWEVGTEFKPWRVGKLAEIVSKIPAEAEVAKMFRVIVAEPGVWLGFSIKFVSTEKVVFTRNTRIVLIDREGRRYESEACLFTPDRVQTEVYDARKSPVVVTRESVYCPDGKGHPLGASKFSKDAFRMEDIVEFEVVGAIEDTTYRETR